jgi:hypothetical protein
MAKGRSKAKVIFTLYKQMVTLVYQLKLSGAAVLLGGRNGKWMLGPWHATDSKEWKGDTTDLTDMTKAFDRKDLSTMMAEVMNRKDPGTTADKMAVRFQSDYISSLDRAFRTRHMGLIRSEIVSAGRRYNNMETILNKTVLEYAQNLISRGQ